MKLFGFSKAIFSKAIKISVVMGAVLLTSCATTDAQHTAGTVSNIGMSLFKSAIDQKCRTELNNQPLYRSVSLIMSDNQKQAVEDRVCGCVSERAPESVSLTDIGRAALDPTARAEVVATAVTKTLSACVNDFINGRSYAN